MTDGTNVDPNAAGGSGASGATPPADAAPPAGGAAGDQTPPAGATPPADGATPPAGDPAKDKPPTGDATPPAFKIPDEYKDKPWAAKIKSEADLFKQLDNLDTLVGKKTVIPDLTKATDEEREAFYAQTRPKDVSEYKFEGEIDPTMKEGIAKSLLKNGVSAVQANAIIKDYQTGEQALLAQQFSPEGMETALKAAFGDNWGKITAETRKSLTGMMSKSDNEMLDNIPNVYLGLLYRTLGNVVKTYGVKETDSAHLDAPGGVQPVDVVAQRAALRDKIAALPRQPHTAEQKQQLQQQLADTYKNDPRVQKQG